MYLYNLFIRELTLVFSVIIGLNSIYPSTGQAQQNQNLISSVTTTPDKCLTPLVIQAYQSNNSDSKSLRDAFESFHEAEIANIEFHLSPSGKFLLSYTRSGTDAVPLADTNSNGIPDYIENAARYADESYNFLVKQRGYVDPVIPGVPYEIRFRQINAYGFTQSQGVTSFIVVHRNFDGFPANNDPDGNRLGALKVTIAHELKHAIQYATSQWQGNTGQVNWLEMDATMIEEVVYPQVADYLNYLDVCVTSACSIFKDPNRSTPGSYFHATWMLYYDLAIDTTFWVDVWAEIRKQPQSSVMFNVMREILLRRNMDFNTEFTRNHLWHFASGSNAMPGYGFPDAALFPTPKTTSVSFLTDTMQELQNEFQINAAQYLVANDLTRQFGDITVTIDYSAPTVGVGLLSYNTNGSWNEHIRTGSSAVDRGFIRIPTGIMAQHVDRFALILANPGSITQQIEFSIYARELPQDVTLTQNYPNPFNPVTSIPFSIPNTGAIRLDILDSQGRLIQTLINETLNPGFYDVPFQGTHLSSGLYLYKLTTPTGVLLGKMLLIK
jgi:hypothetical protein